jgi:uncharacterized membrane protein
MSGPLDILTLAAALGCGLNAGVFFAFSAFVMDGLARASAPEGIAAMQWINRRAPTPAFLLAWLGTGVLCLALAIWTAASGGDRRAVLAIAAAVLYLAGSIGVTFARNVPMNDRLDATDARDPASAGFWRAYVSRWTAWNHVRAIASLVAAGLLTVALTEA